MTDIKSEIAELPDDRRKRLATVLRAFNEHVTTEIVAQGLTEDEIALLGRGLSLVIESTKQTMAALGAVANELKS